MNTSSVSDKFIKKPSGLDSPIVEKKQADAMCSPVAKKSLRKPGFLTTAKPLTSMDISNISAEFIGESSSLDSLVPQKEKAEPMRYPVAPGSPVATTSSSKTILSTPDQARILDDMMENHPVGKRPNPFQKQVVGDFGHIVKRKAEAAKETPTKSFVGYILHAHERLSELGESPYTQNARAIHSIKQERSWTGSIANEASKHISDIATREIPQFQDLTHLVNQKKDGSGSHIWRKEYSATMQNIVVSATGVISAVWETGDPRKPTKHSSYYPADMDIKSVARLLREENLEYLSRYVPIDPLTYLIRTKEEGMIIEARKDPDHALIRKSAIPVFRYIQLREPFDNTPITQQTFFEDKTTPESFSASSRRIEEAANRVLQARRSIAYINQETKSVVVDIASQLSETQVPRGIYAEVPLDNEQFREIEQFFTSKKERIENKSYRTDRKAPPLSPTTKIASSVENLSILKGSPPP